MLDNKLSFYWHFRLWVQADITTLSSTGLDNCMYLCKNCFIQTMSLPHLPPFLLRIHKVFWIINSKNMVAVTSSPSPDSRCTGKSESSSVHSVSALAARLSPFSPTYRSPRGPWPPVGRFNWQIGRGLLTWPWIWQRTRIQ